MKFISHIRRFTVVIMRDVKVIENGMEREVVPLYQAEFKGADRGGPDLSADELAFAERLWDRTVEGRTYEIDEITPTPLIGRLSTFNTQDPDVQADFDRIDRLMTGREHTSLPMGEKWQPGHMQALTEKILAERAPLSQGTFALVEEIPLVAPWPTYTQFPGDVEDLLDVLIQQGHHLPAVLAFEQQQKVHPDLIPLLEDQIAADMPANVPTHVPGDVIPA